MAETKYDIEALRKQREANLEISFNPDPKEYEQSNLGALALSVNSLAAAVSRGVFENQIDAPEEFRQKPFQRDAIREELEKAGYSPNVIDGVMSSPINNWEAAFTRANFLRKKESANEQIAENFSTTEQVLLSFPLALADWDLLVGAPIFRAGQKLAPAIKGSDRLNAAVSYGAGGLAVGGASEAVYQATTGEYSMESLANTALVSAVLTGGFGTVFGKTASNADEVVPVNRTTGEEIPPTTAKQNELKAAQEELDELNSVIEEIQTKSKEQVTTKKEVDKAKKEEVGLERNAEKAQVQRAKERVAFLNKVKKAKKEVYDRLTKERTRFSKQYNKSTKDIEKQEQVQRERTQQALDATLDNIKKLKGTVKKLELDLKKIKKGKAKRIEVATELAEARRQYKLESDFAKALNKRKLQLKPPQENEKRKAVVSKVMDDRKPLLDESLQEYKEAERAYDKAVEEYKKLKDRPAPTEGTERLETRTLRERLEALDADLSPEGIQKLLEARQLVSDDIAKLEKDDFNLSKLRSIKIEKVNKVKKLKKELDEISQAEDFRNADTYKNHLPNWAQKLVISPIEKLLRHPDPRVRGFASMIHSGTLSRGKIVAKTAFVIKEMLNNRSNRVLNAMGYNYKQAVKEGYKGSKDDFEADVAKNLRKVTGAIQRELNEGISGDIVGKAREDLMMERIGSVSRKHSSDNKWIQKSTDDILDYFEYIHSYGNKLGMESFAKSIGIGYAKRAYSRTKIMEMGEDNAIQRLIDAQVSWARSTNSELTDEIIETVFRPKAEAAVRGTIDGTLRRQEVTESLGLPKQSSTNSLKQRTIDAFDDDLMDLMEDEVSGAISMYARGVHGRLALKEKIGIENNQQLEDLFSQLNLKGDDLDNARVIVETILGTREISKNPFDPFTRAVKAVSSYSSAMRILGFAVPTITETSAIAAQYGWRKTLDTFFGSTKTVIDGYRKGTPSEKNTIEMFVSYADALFNIKASRFDMDNSLDSVGAFQQFLDGVVHKGAVYGGLLPVTDMLRMTTASLTVDFLANLSVANKISKTDRIRLQDMGFDLEDLPRIKETLNVQPDGRIGNTDRTTWGTLDDDITASVITAVDRTILHPNGITLPKFMTNVEGGGFVPNIMFKFMRFPFDSYERLMLRGMQQADAKQAMALVGNVAMWAAILSAKDAMREDDKQMYQGADGMKLLLRDSMLYNSFTSLPVAGADTISGILTGQTAFAGYPYSFGGAAATDIYRARNLEARLNVPFTYVNLDIKQAAAEAVEQFNVLNDFWD